MISPFIETSCNKTEDGKPAVSYGISPAGYDFRLSAEGFKVYESTKFFEPLDVKNLPNLNKYTMDALCFEGEHGKFYELPPLRSGLGTLVEHLNVPENVQITLVGKSTYARAGIFVNITPAEPGWKGYLTIEIFNSNVFPVKLYVDEGICQGLFDLIESPDQTYATRSHSKYQNQGPFITPPKM